MGKSGAKNTSKEMSESVVFAFSSPPFVGKRERVKREREERAF